MLVLYRMDDSLYRSEVMDSTDVGLRQGLDGAWNLSFTVSDRVYVVNGMVVTIQCADKEAGEAAIRKMCEYVRFVDLTKFQGNE